jgi:hypothetical protein
MVKSYGGGRSMSMRRVPALTAAQSAALVGLVGAKAEEAKAVGGDPSSLCCPGPFEDVAGVVAQGGVLRDTDNHFFLVYDE